MDMPTTATALLSDIKTQRGLSEVAIARRLQISQPTVNRILRGSRTARAVRSWRYKHGGKSSLNKRASHDARSAPRSTDLHRRP
ncbi:helix-turn-helix domain-containing protein [Burkholderia multivorans]|uniref:helix-turn-helix domain-containing protein n=1 Tax=Burkholderia multivorans TaxID=87883 RepID=UPI00358ED923